jgi:hypothetical protein
MHDNVKNAINSFQQEKVYNAGEKGIWIPQFKIGDKSHPDEMKSEEPIKNFKVKDGDPKSEKEEEKPVYIQEYMH